MSSIKNKYVKAIDLINSGKVKLDSQTEKHIYMTAGDYSVVLSPNGEGDSCNCPYGSLYGVNKKNPCYHILACWHYFMNKLEEREQIPKPEIQA